jgi:hypothetical protein
MTKAALRGARGARQVYFKPPMCTNWRFKSQNDSILRTVLTDFAMVEPDALGRQAAPDIFPEPRRPI